MLPCLHIHYYLTTTWSTLDLMSLPLFAFKLYVPALSSRFAFPFGFVFALIFSPFVSETAVTTALSSGAPLAPLVTRTVNGLSAAADLGPSSFSGIDAAAGLS